MELEESSNQQNPDTEKGAKENSSAAGNHGDAHMNGMSNGYDRRKEHKSEHRSKERSSHHKSEHRDKDKDKDRSRSDKEKSHKSEHRDKDKDRHKHSSSSSSKDKDRHHSSSSKDKDKDKDKDKEKDKEKKSSSSSKDHKSSSSSSKDKSSRDHHKSSSSSKHHSSSSSKDKDKEREKDKDKEREKDKERSKDKDKDRHRHSSSKDDRDKEKSSSSSSKDKDRKHSDKDRHSHSSSDKSKDRHRHDKDKHRHDKHRHDKDKEREHRKEEQPKIKEESPEKTEESHYNNHVAYEPKYEIKHEIKDEPVTQVDVEEDGNSSSDEPGLYIKEEEDDDEYKQDASTDDGNDTRLSELHNTTVKTEEESDEDVPLAARRLTSSPSVKRKNDSDEDEDIPLAARKKVKKESDKTKKKKKRKNSDDDDDDDFQEQKPKKKPAKARRSEPNTPSPRKRKKEEEEEQEVWKWWKEKPRDDGKKWTSLEHKGPVFAPDYERLPPDVKFYYNGKEMKLSQDTEEVATFYARMLDHDYTTKQAFNDNFFHDWRNVMTEDERKRITDLEKCNFKEMHTYFQQKSEERKQMSKEEKKALKEKNDEITKEYGVCKIDGHVEKIGNFKIEPPGLFRGRGEHPKMGKLKKRVWPEDVIINCSKDSVIPKAPSGHRWREVRHDPTVTWLASWTENVQGQVKYVMLNPSSKIKGQKDMDKYNTARRLATLIDNIRKKYREDWKSKEMRVRQRAVALYFIDKLALRAGNEKDEDQADTVGCCSLRVEHIQLHEKRDDKEYVVVFDFLGKDSIRYYNEVPVEKRVFKNLELFMENKSTGDDLFDRITTTDLNKHLNELMDGLTAKVFRTYNASITLQQQLEKLTNPDDSIAEKLLSYNRANRAVAILCNHQRAVPKTHAKSMENLKGKIEAKKEAIAEAEKAVKSAKKDARDGSVKGKDLYDKKKKQLERLREQLGKLEVQATDKEENKEIALGTSKLNYLDPRISVAWCKKFGVPIEKIYNKTQRDKFKWAIDMATEDYDFLSLPENDDYE